MKCALIANPYNQKVVAPVENKIKRRSKQENSGTSEEVTASAFINFVPNNSEILRQFF